MLDAWLFSLVSLAYVSVITPLQTSFLEHIIAFGILAITPLFIPLVAMIRRDMSAAHSVRTQAGLFGIGILTIAILLLLLTGHLAHHSLSVLLLIFLGAFFRLDARLFFLGGLFLLCVVAICLLLGKTHIANTMSINLYYLLAIGVSTEILTPIFRKWHQNSRAIIPLSPEFLTEYRRELGRLLVIILFGLFGAIILPIFASQIRVAYPDLPIYASIALVSVFFLSLFLRETPYHWRDFFLHSRWYSALVRDKGTVQAHIFKYLSFGLVALGILGLFGGVSVPWGYIVGYAILMLFCIILEKIIFFALRYVGK